MVKWIEDALSLMDIQYFLDTTPQRIHRRLVETDIQQIEFPYETDDAVRAWCEHDAIHYLSGQPFTLEGEECVAYLELMFNRGWLPLGEQYNSSFPRECECGIMTAELIDETAEIIYEFYDEHS
jgi:hypothetical protein